MAIENFQPARHSLVSSVYYRAYHGWAWKNFQSRSSQMDRKRYFGFLQIAEPGYSFFRQNLQNLC